MPIKILMPALSPTMKKGNIAKWVKNEGDKIFPGDAIVEIETDKATMEVEVIDEGILRIIVPQGSENIAVNSLIAVLVEENDSEQDVKEFIEKNQSKNVLPNEALAAQVTSLSQELASHEASTSDNTTSTAGKISDVTGSRIFASPLAKRIAIQEGISLVDVIGSGPRGRIVKSDLTIVRGSGVNKQGLHRNSEEYRLVPNNNIRKIIAKRLLDSKITVPHFYLSIECIMDQLMEVRGQINISVGEDKSKRISVNDFIILASAKALKDIPAANSSWSDSAIKIYNNVDISVAVAIDGGLITPIIKNADQKDIMKISAEIKELVKKAREGTLLPEEFQGGGFSISNLGMYGIKNFSAIINPPQGCIMAVGMSSKRAVVIDDKIEIRTIMDVTISCDHRVIDGAIGAQFLASFKKYIEAPILMFV